MKVSPLRFPTSETRLCLTVAGGRHTLRCYKDNAVAIDLRNLSNVFVDSEKGVAYVGGGAKLWNLDLECEAHGNKYTVAGTNASTGVGGYTRGFF